MTDNYLANTNTNNKEEEDDDIDNINLGRSQGGLKGRQLEQKPLDF